MEFTELGSTGLKISRLSLGAWQFSEAWGMKDYGLAKSIVAKALEVGINFIDTAMIYGRGMSEDFLGRALQELGVKRDEVVIATKIPGEFLSPEDVPRAIERSLARLRTESIDLLLIHWPPAWHNFPTCTYMRALERAVNVGAVNYLGLSDYPVELAEAARACLAREDLVALQVRFNLAERWAEAEHIPYAEANGLTLMAWSPLGKGALTGKYSLEEAGRLQDVRMNEALFHPKNYSQVLELVNVIREIGNKYGKTPAQVALNWLISYSDVIVPIVGARSPSQVEENVGAVGWRLSFEDWRSLDEASKRLKITYVTW
ncbi:MAG: aldo/keto reductase [Acidilobaceae archaeon]|nr:aldo/keto reductase [Acidilobaceae archaeon]MCX8165250.1 aldo/keto reductase [Acidilobaceae archaeon]MDW7973676.1 aldo/keto reductase [Sulfolobales archaeon]